MLMIKVDYDVDVVDDDIDRLGVVDR